MAEPKRVYQVWKGHNKFLFNGRLIFGANARSLVVTLMLILVPIIIFCTNVARKIIPAYNAGYAILVVAVVFTVYVLVLLLTSPREPDVVPLNSQPPEEEISYDSSSSSEAGGRETLISRLPSMEDVPVNGVHVKVKYCDTSMSQCIGVACDLQCLPFF